MHIITQLFAQKLRHKNQSHSPVGEEVDSEVVVVDEADTRTIENDHIMIRIILLPMSLLKKKVHNYKLQLQLQIRLPEISVERNEVEKEVEEITLELYNRI